jgi:hypothetical protein
MTSGLMGYGLEADVKTFWETQIKAIDRQRNFLSVNPRKAKCFGRGDHACRER